MKKAAVGFACLLSIGLLPAWAQAKCTVTPSAYGVTKAGRAIERYDIQGDGLKVGLLTYGGVLHDIEAPGRNGQMGNVILTLPDLASYESHPSFSSLLGRYANRISGGGFDLDGQHFALEGHNGITTHGGPDGFGQRVWTAKVFRQGKACGVDLSLISPDGDQGFPGALAVSVRYAVEPGGRLAMTYTAHTTKPTVVTLGNHAYFNLAGTPTVYNQRLSIAADRYLAVDDRSVPTGALVPVAGTGLDLRQETLIGDLVKSEDPLIKKAKGLNHMLALNGSGLRAVIHLSDPDSGRVLTVSTTEPGLVTYTANGFDGSFSDASGRPIGAGAGISFELQHYPDSPHQADFPSTVLRPGEVYTSKTVYRFTAN
jgi:aldose 1-epimerase